MNNYKDRKNKVYLRTFGCQMNEHDSEIIRSILESNGFSLDADESTADIILLNTCAVREHAVRKIFGLIHDIRHRRNGNSVIFGILGCVASNLKEKLLENKSLKVNIIAGPDNYRDLPNLIMKATGKNKKSSSIQFHKEETYSDIYPQRESGANAWITVMRGCDNFCSFCVVPYTRGRERSQNPDNIIKEASAAAKAGYKQITLLGQNVNSYKYDKCTFADLINSVSKIKGIERIRFTSPHPKDFPTDLIQVSAENDKVCKHIHLPLQAGNNRVLEMMNRPYTQEEYLNLVKRIKDAYPNMAFSTDIIVGFPTETEKEFNDTLKTIELIEFDSAFIFKYSPREGTIAQKKYPDDVPEKEKTRRIVLLNKIQKDISLKKNQALVGKTSEVMVESVGSSEKNAEGRTSSNKRVTLPKGEYSLGQLLKVKITKATPHLLKSS